MLEQIKILGTSGKATIILLVLLSVGVYVNSFPGSFFMDDVAIIQTNPMVAHPHLKTIFTSDYFGVELNTGTYRPLTILSLALNQFLLGPEPWAFHLVNVLLHALATVLLITVFSSIGAGPVVSWCAAAIFAVHPIHTEAINQVVGRSELLVTVFLLMAIRFAFVSNRWGMPLVLSCYAAALLCKEHAITFLAVLPLVDLFVSRRSPAIWRRRIPLYLMLLLITLLWLALRVWGVDRGGLSQLHNPFYTLLGTLPPLERVFVGLRLQLFYLLKLLVPWKLHGVYAADDLLGPMGGFSIYWSLLPLVFLGGAAGSVVYGWRRHHISALAFLLYAVSFSVTSNVLFATGVMFAERLAYWPSVWFCLGLVSVGDAFLSEKKKLIITAVSIAYFGFLCGRTLLRNMDYSSPVRLWSVDVLNNPQNLLAVAYLADAQLKNGQISDAMKSYQHMVELAPNFVDGLVSYAQALLGNKQVDVAVEYAKRATEIDATKFTPMAHLTLAQAYQQQGQYEKSLMHLEKLGKSCKTYDGYWATLGKSLEALGDFEGALKSYRIEQSVYVGEESDVYVRIGDLLMKMHRPAEAEPVYRQELARHADAAIWNRLGVALALQGKGGDALEAFTEAARLRPDSMEYRSNVTRARAAVEEAR